MNRISVVLIVKNEELLLTRCLDSVREADEFVVVDTGSTDKTMDVLRAWAEDRGVTDKVRTGFFAWCDDFSAARNYAKSLATGDWILTIDADEYLVGPFDDVRQASVQAFMAANVRMPSEADPPTVHYFPKLFRNSEQVWWNGAIHNHLSVNGEDTASVPTIVYGFSPAHAIDPVRTLRILEREVATRPDAVREMFYLGREYYYRRQYEQSVIMLGRYVQKSEQRYEKADAFYIMARGFHALSQWSDARDACVQALIINPHFKEACCFMAVLSGLKHDDPRFVANGQQWMRMAETADNRNVMFVRPLEV